METHNVRGDVSVLLEAIRGLRRNDSSSEDEGTIAITTDVPGLQEAILRHAGERVVQQREPPTVDRVGEGEVRMRNIHPNMMRAIMGRNGTQAKVKMKHSGTMLNGLTNIDIF